MKDKVIYHEKLTPQQIHKAKELLAQLRKRVDVGINIAINPSLNVKVYYDGEAKAYYVYPYERGGKVNG